MIDYKLAKQLKDTGWPQGLDYGQYCWLDTTNLPFKCMVDDEFTKPTAGNFYKIPTLLDLIEACGEWFLCLIRMPDNTWRTNINRPTANIVKTIINGSDYIVGDTPEEAIAKLWLKINE